MLSRSSKSYTIFKRQRRCFSAASEAFSNWSDRQNSLKQSYPSLFGSGFISDQESLISSSQSSQSSLLSKYNDSRKQIDENSGESIFIEYNSSNLPSIKPVYTKVQKESQFNEKLNTGKEFVENLLKINNVDGLSIEDTNLAMIKIADYADKIDDWRNRLSDDIDDSTDLGLPITDKELDAWVNYEYHHAPGNVVDQGILSKAEYEKVEQEWFESLDEKLVGILRERLGNNFDEDRWRDFTAKTNEMFHPHNIDHYTLSNYSKSLFRAGLWQGEKRLNALEKSMNAIDQLLNDPRDNDIEIIRNMYENNAERFKFKKLVALQLAITDPLFAAKLCDEARSKLEEVSAERAIKDVLRDLEVPMIEKEKAEAEEQLRSAVTDNTSTMKRRIELLTQERNSFDVDVPSLESVLDDILPKRLWGADINGVKSAIVSYAKGNGSLENVNKEIEAVMEADSESGTMDDSEKLKYAIEYHNSRFSNREWWNLTDFLKATNQYRKVTDRIVSKRQLKKRLDNLGIDPLVVNLVRILIDDKQTNSLQQIVYDFIEIMKRYRGEIDGVVMTPVSLDDDTFNSIQNALVQANPGKKITLKQQIEPALSAGFIVKAGVQRFDFSLSTVIYEGRKAVGN